jgi:putative ABC transport system permease protein
LKEGSHTTTAGSVRQHFRRALVVTQVAIAFVLLVGAGLLGRSFMALLDVDPGFVREFVVANKALTLEIQLRGAPRSNAWHFSTRHWRSLSPCLE